MANPFYLKISEDDLYFTSDTHFYHEKIIQFANRPYNNVEHMNEELVSNWNKVVPPSATVFHLGDFSFGNKQEWKNIREKLNGKIHLIIGNHDIQNYKGMKQDGLFESVSHVQYVEIKGETNRVLILQHYPLLEWPLMTKIWHLHGHCHDNPTRENPIRLNTQYDVGVDNNNYTPISYREIVKIINKKQNG